MDEENEYSFFKLRKQGKTYISRLFDFVAGHQERMRQIRMVFEGCDEQVLGEIEGAICLRITGNVRKTQVTALVSQDDRQVRRLSFQSFQTRAGECIQSYDKNEFTFRAGEFDRLLNFLSQIEFVNLSNTDRFQIEDISSNQGPKAIIDATDRSIVERVKGMNAQERRAILNSLQPSLTAEEVNIVLGRKQSLEEFEGQMLITTWDEQEWKDFFEREQWVFGYGLDYRIMRQFDREIVVAAGGTDNRNRPIVDFLMTFTHYTVLVEVKRPDTPIFRKSRAGRAGTWEFSPEFTGAVSQILEQKAEWLSFAQHGEHHNRSGTENLSARTRDTKSILLIGSCSEFTQAGNGRDEMIMRDTFELFRRDTRNIEIVTFDELLERARFITR